MILDYSVERDLPEPDRLHSLDHLGKMFYSAQYLGYCCYAGGKDADFSKRDSNHASEGLVVEQERGRMGLLTG